MINVVSYTSVLPATAWQVKMSAVKKVSKLVLTVCRSTSVLASQFCVMMYIMVEKLQIHNNKAANWLL